MTSQKRNVLLLIADDWSPVAGCYGQDWITTPNIDALAARGTVYDHAYCTTPSCAASRANILTGLYSHQHGQYGHSHGKHGFQTHTNEQWVRSMPAVLRDVGVFSGLIGKSHVAPAEVYPFDLWDEGDGWSTRTMADKARQAFDQIGDRPFYLHCASLYPHRSSSKFDAGNCADEYAATDIDYDPASIPVPGFLPDNADTRRDLADYYRFVSRYDHFVGQMVTALNEAGRADDTLIIVMTDHAMPFVGAKASSFDTGHRCPLIVVDPSQPAASRCDAMVNWCDIAPTVYDWIGVADHAPGFLPGKSLLPTLGQASPVGWDHTYFAHNFHEVTNYYPYRILRERQYKFVRNLASPLPMPLPTDLFRSPNWQSVCRDDLQHLGERTRQRTLYHDAEELYDTDADPMETTNLIDRLPEVASRMREQLTAFRHETGDLWLEVDYQQGRLATDPKVG